MRVIALVVSVLASIFALGLIAVNKSETNKYFGCLRVDQTPTRQDGPIVQNKHSSFESSQRIVKPPALPAANELINQADGPNKNEDRGQDKPIEVGSVVVHDIKYEFAAKCQRPFGSKFTRQPAVHFYSFKKHSEATSGCGPNVEIELQQINGKLSVNPKLDTNNIKQLLIDTKLFNPRAQTYFMTHGFLSNWNGVGWQCDLKDLILNNSAANVFIVDWSGGSMLKDYRRAVSNTVYVGALLGEFIKSLMELTGKPDASQYHMIGHSLGAHISGFAGYYLNGTLGHITALDPAGPCFKARRQLSELAAEDGFLGDGSRRLSRQSARSVVALHSDALLFGLKQSCAHHDVYVNGGNKQPDCDSKQDDPAGRSLSLSEFWNEKLPCRHAYAYKLLNQFVNIRALLEERAVSKVAVENNNSNRCYLMAYQCGDWNSFRVGECGFCMDDGGRCLFVGVSLLAKQPARVDSGASSGSYEQFTPLAPQMESHSDDDQFNDEAGSGGLDDDPEYQSIKEYSRGQHFIVAGTAPMTCLFQYQIIVAARRQSAGLPKESSKHYYYLHIPLELSGRLNSKHDNRLNDRLVQVSHKLNADSPAYNYLKTAYLDALGRGAHHDELDFYTALITFEPVVLADKCQDNPTNGAGRKKKWQICTTLDNIQEARLWSSSEAKLDSVVWVGMNYMSGFDYEQRMSESYVFTRDQNEPIRTRAEIQKSSRAKLTEKSPVGKNLFVNKLASVARSLDCLLSKFETSQRGDARRKFKCVRSRKELLYAIKLQPTSLGPAY